MSNAIRNIGLLFALVVALTACDGINSGSSGDKTSDSAVTIFLPAPGTFQAVRNVSIPTTANLTWDAVPGAKSYLVEEATSDTFTNITNTHVVFDIRATLSVDRNQTHYFRIRACSVSIPVRSQEHCGASAQAHVTTLPAPGNFTVVQNAAMLNMAWDGVTGAKSYLIEEATSDTFANITRSVSRVPVVGLTFFTLGEGTSQKDERVPNKLYYFRIRACSDFITVYCGGARQTHIRLAPWE